jgi:ATP-dependent protease ClpP protease subunit
MKEKLMTQQHKDYYYAVPNSVTYTYYLDDEVTDSSDYRELLQMLFNAGEDDVVRIVLSNYGGSLSTCVAIVNGIRSCRATTVGVLTSVAYSAAGAIWLACEGQEVHNHVGFMSHDGQGGTFGSMFQQKQHIEHSMAILRSLYEDVYKHFLSPEEIDTVLKNGDLWLTENEIIERLEKRSAIFKQEHEDKQKAAYDEMFAEFEGDEIPDEILKKLTKSQLIDYIKDEIDIVINEDGSFEIVDVEEIEQ